MYIKFEIIVIGRGECLKFKMKKEMFTILIFIVVFAFLLGAIYVSLPLKEGKYIEKNSKSIDLTNNENYTSLDIFDRAIKDKKVIITSEEIGIKESTKIQQKFISYLMDKWQLKYYLTYIGYAEAAIVNEYLQTGDENILKAYENSKSGYAFSSEVSQDMLRAIYAKNSKLPDEKKLRIIGIGMNEAFEFIDLYFKMIIDKNSKLTQSQIDNINNFLNDLQNKDIMTNISSEKDMKARNKIILGYIDVFCKDIDENQESYREALGDDFHNIEFVIENIKKREEFIVHYYGSSEDSDIQEAESKYLYENFKEIYKKFDMKKCYIHLPQIYSYQHEALNTDFPGAKLAKDKEFENKVFEINVLYGNGKFNLDGSVIEKYAIREDLKEILKEIDLDKEDLAINLDNSRSPYRKKFTPIYFPFQDDLLYPQESIDGTMFGGIIGEEPGVVTDYFQGVIIIENPSLDESIYEKIYKVQD